MNEWAAIVVSSGLLGAAVWLTVRARAVHRKLREQDKEIESLKQKAWTKLHK